MSSSTTTPLYMIIGALASLFSSLKIVQTRRRLQKDRNVPVSLTEAVIHSLFDAVDRVNNQASQIAMIMDERMNQSTSIPMLQQQYSQQPKMLLSSGMNNNTTKQSIPSLTFNDNKIHSATSSTFATSSMNNKSNQIPLVAATIKNNHKPIITNFNETTKLSDPMLASIPNNSFKLS